MYFPLGDKNENLEAKDRMLQLKAMSSGVMFERDGNDYSSLSTLNHYGLPDVSMRVNLFLG